LVDFGQPFVKRFALCYRTVVLSVCDVGVLWPNVWTDQDETRRTDRPRPWPHCIRFGPSSAFTKGAQPPISAHICCGQMAGWIKMPLGRKVGLDPSDIVFDGDPAVKSPKGGHRPLIFAPFLLWPYGWMDQHATWHGGRPRPRPHCARWGPKPHSPKKGAQPPISAHIYCGQTARWIKMPLGMEVGLGPGHIVLGGDLAPPP